MAQSPIDYDALAKQHGGQPFDAVDYDALAAEIAGAPPEAPGVLKRFADQFGANMQTGADLAIGAAKGIGSTVTGLGRAVQKIPGVRQAVDTLYGQPGLSEAAFAEADRALAPTSTAQSVGKGVEQAAEYLLPGKAATLPLRMAGSAGLATVQGASPTGAGLAAAGEAVLPGGRAAVRAGKALVNQAEPLVQAALKPTIASLKKMTSTTPGRQTLDAKAKGLVRFIIDNRLTTPEKAERVIQQSEGALKSLLGSATATDAPRRAMRYLEAVERSAARQALPEADVAAVRNAAAELVRNELGEDVIRMVPAPHPTLVGANGQPLMVMKPEISRQLRSDVGPGEAMDRARAMSQWGNKKAWGEQKGASVEASKSVERALRDAVKEAVPAARPVLARQGMAIRAFETLDRATQRTGNRDAASLPAHVIAAGEIASGRVPVLAIAANWLRNNQMKAGIWADRLGKAVQSGDSQRAAEILKRLGVSVPAALTQESR
jgi:hypothetical protein